MTQDKRIFIEAISIKPNYTVSYSYPDVPFSKSDKWKAPPTKAEQTNTGEISVKGKRRLLTALDWMLLISQDKKINGKKGKGKFRYKLAMLTLTLPSKQVHDDCFIKKHMLGSFLDWLRKEYNCQLYIWKAEKQENGNIHFHLIINKYIHHAEINKKWNSINAIHGYIDAFRKNMQQFHSSGFNSATWSGDKRTLAERYEAYKEGVKTNWSNPIASSDIHSLHKIKNARAYLGKYISKNPDETKVYKKGLECLKKVYGEESIPEFAIKQLKEEVTAQFKVDGHIWYVSHALSNMKGFMDDMSRDMRLELMKLSQNFKDKVIDKEYCTIFNFSIIELWKLGCKTLVQNFGNYILSLRQKFRWRCDDLFSSMGIPIPNLQLVLA
jgi:hypothetical protein